MKIYLPMLRKVLPLNLFKYETDSRNDFMLDNKGLQAKKPGNASRVWNIYIMGKLP